MPKSLFKRLALTFLVGTGCFFVGVLMLILKRDVSFFLLSLMIFLCSVCKCIAFFRRIQQKSYVMVEGTCCQIQPLFFRSCNKIILEDAFGNHMELLLDKNQKLREGVCYRIYLHSMSGISSGFNPFLKKALLTDNLLGIEVCDPPSTTSDVTVQL